MATITTAPPPTQEIRILCSTGQLAKVAAQAAAKGQTIEEFVNHEFLAKLDPKEDK